MNPTENNAQGKNTHSYPAYDYAVGIGTGLVACKPGTIVDFPGISTRGLIGHMQNGDAWPVAGGGSPNSGNVITIDHGNGEYTCYLHVSPYNVNATRGQKVVQGQVFHRSGNNGWSTGPHLHFEVWKNGVRIDPGPWLANINQGGDVSTVGDVELNMLSNAFFGYPANAEFIKAWQGTESNTMIRWCDANPAHVAWLKQVETWKNDGGTGEFVETKVYVKKG